MESYTTVTKLGKGACGEVFLVRHRKTNKLAALKTIQLDERRKNRTKSAVLREARILSQLKHPNIVAYHDSFFNETDEHLCIVQDYCDGGTLDDKIQDTARKKKYLGEKLIMKWFIQIAMAVQYMHSQKVLHRDLKTQNVFMNKSGTTCKLGDFGISKMMETTVDLASTCVGTPCYLAPEMCQDIPYSSKADVWALGCLLYEMCALRPAFDAHNLISLFYKIMKAEIEVLPLQYTDSIRSLVETILNKNPEERPSTRQILLLPYVKEQMTEFVTELINLSELREKESPSRAKPRSSRSPLKHTTKHCTSADSSPVNTSRQKRESVDKSKLSRTMESAILLPIPIQAQPEEDTVGRNICVMCGQIFTLRSFLQKHISKKHACENKQDDSLASTRQEKKNDNVQNPSPGNKQVPQEKQDADTAAPNDVEYEDDFEDSSSDDEENESLNHYRNKSALPNAVTELCVNVSDLEDIDYEDDFEEYYSDEDFDGIVNYCKEYEDAVDSGDEFITDNEPSLVVASYKSLLQEHALQTLGKTKYSEISRGRMPRITEEDIKLTVAHKSGSEHMETCFLVSELLSQTPNSKS